MSDNDDPSGAECQLLGGFFQYLVQFFLGVIAIATLVYKRAVTDSHKRPIDIWLFDVSKQGISSVIIHFWNIGLSILFAHLNIGSDGEGVGSDECAFYFLTFFFDTFLGVLLISLMLKAVKAIATFIQIPSIERQGFYGHPPKMRWYFNQLLVFIFIIIISKFILGLFMYTWADEFAAVGTFLFLPLQATPRLELVTVMVVCPAFLSIIQYWILDNILMNTKHLREEYEIVSKSENNSIL